ncbi:hypothetical protein Tco_0085670 [Tanacetum coccineum]
MIQPEPEGSTQGYLLDSVEVLRRHEPLKLCITLPSHARSLQHTLVSFLREIERFYTSVGNPVKEILLKLNLPDHRSILTDSKEYIKMDMEVPDPSGLTDS